ncbi:acetylxylan esterase [Pedobacter hiemivivus]|uniref:Acetylxylan esterase n=1 Tax=Pedobacter hiemivivus TaxID=2530454 RepID=A0A4U1GIJ1_9SPHI|nr:acetylxylan esterase [Pedobacter hiemivivus]TKC61252.1 acetylxylan esterase [Pedobacter hiemivivus]
MKCILKSSSLLGSLLLCLFCLYAEMISAQPPRTLITVVVAPDHADWTYKTGEKAMFSITVLKDGNTLKNCKVDVQVGPEKMDATWTEKLSMADGKATIDGGTMKSPGFLRCIATINFEGKLYRGLATAGFDPYQIKPTTDMPSDFTAFWDKAKSELSKLPLETKLTLMPERCTEKVNTYQFSVQNFRPGSRLYGMICIPKRPGKYPAELIVPGAGIRPLNGYVTLAEKGIITVEMAIHGIPVTMDPSVYNNLYDGALNEYYSANLDNKDHYYYKRVYMGCVRAVDLICSLPEFDGENIGVFGGSQGGALSVVTAALDSRVKYLVCLFPALSDLTGYLHNRAGGWPHLFNKENGGFNNTEARIQTSKYYDVVNFAKLLKVPGMYSWGFNDETCPPTTTYAVYNAVTAKKELLLARDSGHFGYPEQWDVLNKWMIEKLLPNSIKK